MKRSGINIGKKTLVIRINKELKEKEVQAFSDKIRETADRFESVNLFVSIEHYPSLNVAESLYDDLRFVKWHANRIEKMAVIGDQPWKKHWIAIFGLFGGIQCEYFDRSEADAALQWLGS